MSLGFKVTAQVPPQAPPVIAQPGQRRCGVRWPNEHGVNCERPRGHDGGHRSQSHDKYWPAS